MTSQQISVIRKVLQHTIASLAPDEDKYFNSYLSVTRDDYITLNEIMAQTDPTKRQRLKDLPAIDPEIVISKVADTWNVNRKDMSSKSRKREITDARQVAMMLVNICSKYTTERTGYLFNRDHSTVVHSKKVVRDMYNTTPYYRNSIYNVLVSIYNTDIQVLCVLDELLNED